MNAMIEEAVRDEAVLRAALAEADIAPLLMVLVQLSGDLAILDEVHRISRARGALWRRCRKR